MKLLTTLFSLIIFAFSSVFAVSETDVNVSETWSIDKTHSAINFTITHFFTPVDGTFDDYHAEVIFAPDDLENSSVEISIAVESINTRNGRRDDHLNSEDFFNSSEWPEIHFKSNSIEQTGENQFVASGELTIRDVTRHFDLPFELLGVMENPMQENSKVMGITASTELNRTDFGVGVGDWAATAVVGDKVDIQLNLELNAAK